MRICTRKFFHTILLMLCLLGISGCAQQAYNLKEPSQQVTNAVLKDITITSEQNSTTIRIVSDAPLTYTKYSISEPPRAVIDLSATAAGGVSAPEIANSKIVKNIEILENKDQNGSVVRVVVNLVKNSEFTVTPDRNNGSILYVSFAETGDSAEVASNAGTAADGVTNSSAGTTQGSNQALIEKKEAESANPPQLSAEKENASAHNESAKPVATPFQTEGANKAGLQEKPPAVEDKTVGKVISGLNITGKGIEIVSSKEIERYNSFRMSKPQRLIIDIPDFTTTIVAKSIPINSFELVSARLGIYPEKTRIVFDSSSSQFPKYRIEKSSNGLVVYFDENSTDKKTPVAGEIKEQAAKRHEAAAAGTANNSHIESIDFTTAGGYSKVVVKADSPLVVTTPRRTADGIVMTLKNAVLPARLQRPFDTKSFASSVVRITPYQVRTPSGPDAKILIKLRSDAPFELKSEGNITQLNVKDEESSEAYTGKNDRMAVPQNNFASQGPEKRAGAVPQQATGKKVYTGRRVTLEFADADIRKIFQLIAEVSNLNFLLGDDVTGTISIKLVNVPWDQALDVILETKGLGMKRDGNIVVVRPAGKIQTLADERQAEKRALERGMELKTKVFDINYAAVADIANQFNSFKSERGIVVQDPRTNRVIVTDIEPSIEKMIALLKALDIPEKQVMIEARIVEATSSFTRDLGIQWGIHTRGEDVDVDAGFGGIISGTASSVPGSTFGPGVAAGLSFGKLIKDGTLDIKLYAAASNGQVKIISTPKVVTLNNKAAKIAQGQSIPYQTVSAEGTKTEFVEAALTLEVTPHITADGSVSMKIKATNNSAGSAPAGSVPPINKKEATTELLVKNGETTVIGGIYQDSDSESDDGVPWLKDIPLLGWLFKSNNISKQKTELLIFITPKIVS